MPNHPRKTRKRKNTDSTWAKVKEKIKKPTKNDEKYSGLLNFRCIHTKTTETGSPYKHHFHLRPQKWPLSPKSFSKLESTVKETAKNIPGFREATIIKTSTNGSPLALQTPGGTRLSRSKDFGNCVFFDNNKQNPALLSPQIDRTKFIPIKADNAVALFPASSQKTISAALTNTERKKHKRGCKEARAKAPQNKVIARHQNDPVSATQHVVNCGIDKNQIKKSRWEWIHGVAVSIIGLLGQVENNLSAATFACNSDMLATIESQIHNLFNTYDDELKITVITDLFNKTHIAKKIEYIVSHHKNELIKMQFDSLNTQTPHIAVYHVFKILMDNYCGILKEKKAALSPATSSQRPTPK